MTNAIIYNNGEKKIEIKAIENGTEKQNSFATEVKANLISNLIGWLSQPGMSKHEERIVSAISKINNVSDFRAMLDNKDMNNKESIIFAEKL